MTLSLERLRALAAEYAATHILDRIDAPATMTAQQLADAAPALLAHIDAQAAEIARLRDNLRGSRRIMQSIYSMALKRHMIGDEHGEMIDLARLALKEPVYLHGDWEHDGESESDTAMPETNISDYVDCPCCGGQRYTPDGGECGCCDATGAVTKDAAAAIAREDEGGDV